MTVFDVFLNDRKLCRAGVGRDGVLSVIANWVRLTGEAAEHATRVGHPLEEMRLHVGGLRGNTHSAWVDRFLGDGDRLAVEVRRASRADPAVRTKRARRAPAPKPAERTTFLNVDLDVHAREPLDHLVAAMGRSVTPLFVGQEGRNHVAHLEIAGRSTNPNVIVRKFVALIDRLPKRERNAWARARRRVFNVGIQAATLPYSFELTIDPEVVAAAARVDASIVTTVYAPAPVRTKS